MSRFVDRQVTIQELIWQQKGAAGDMEAIALLLEARRSDPTLDIRSMDASELPALITECGDRHGAEFTDSRFAECDGPLTVKT